MAGESGPCRDEGQEALAEPTAGSRKEPWEKRCSPGSSTGQDGQREGRGRKGRGGGGGGGGKMKTVCRNLGREWKDVGLYKVGEAAGIKL